MDCPSFSVRLPICVQHPAECDLYDARCTLSIGMVAFQNSLRSDLIQCLLSVGCHCKCAAKGGGAIREPASPRTTNTPIADSLVFMKVDGDQPNRRCGAGD